MMEITYKIQNGHFKLKIEHFLWFFFSFSGKKSEKHREFVKKKDTTPILLEITSFFHQVLLTIFTSFDEKIGWIRSKFWPCLFLTNYLANFENHQYRAFLCVLNIFLFINGIISSSKNWQTCSKNVYSMMKQELDWCLTWLKTLWKNAKISKIIDFRCIYRFYIEK
jgi:hypothetical protein